MDYRSEIEHWAGMWDDMQKSNIHPAIEKPQPSPYSAGDTAQDHYFDLFDDEHAETMLQEEKVPNPVYPDSAGVDNQHPKPAWVREDFLKEVETLKNRLFRLENQMARLGQGKKFDEKKVHGMFDKSMFAEIRSLRTRIDKVSSQLGIKDEPSPWQVKRG